MSKCDENYNFIPLYLCACINDLPSSIIFSSAPEVQKEEIVIEDQIVVQEVVERKEGTLNNF